MNLNTHVLLPFLVFWPMIASIVSYLIGRRNKNMRDYFADAVTAVEFLVAVYMVTVVVGQGTQYFPILWFGHGEGLLFEMDAFRSVYAVITTLMWMCTTIFSKEYFAHYRNRNRYYLFMLMTEGATVAVFISGDVLTLFTFFEVMAFTSYVMVIHDEKPGAQRASETYTYLNVFGGLVTLMGIFILYNTIGTLRIDLIKDACAALPSKAPLYWAAGLMIVGFGGKSGMFPLHVWLPKAHPVAPAPASALLSGVLTKTGVYGIIIISAHMLFGDWVWGCILLGIAVITMFGGAFLALFSVDLKRTLACSSMSQIGFILTAVSMQCVLMANEDTQQYHFYAQQGAVLHMMNHSLIKLVLFMAAGVVYMNLHQLDLNEVRGFGYRKPLLKFIFGMGVLAIIGLPFWSGYVSKTLIHESIVERIWTYHDFEFAAHVFRWVESIFTLTGGLTTAYMTKIYICVFWEKNPYKQAKMDSTNKKYMNKASAITLTACSLILPVLGMTLYKTMIPISEYAAGFFYMTGHPHEVHFFEWACLKGAFASLSIGAILYILVVRGCLMKRDENGNKIYINAWPKFIDIEDYAYRPLMLKVLPFIGAFVTRTIGSVVEVIGKIGFNVFWKIRNWYMPRKPNAHEFIAKSKEWYPKHKVDGRANVAKVKAEYDASGIETWDKHEENRTITPMERIPLLDDWDDAMKARADKPSWIERLIAWVKNARNNAFHVPGIHRWFDRSVEEFGDAKERTGAVSLLRQTMSYGLLVFALALLVIVAYVIFAAL
ncbi:MAG: NADH dehydrogenase [Lachnospiraceae bacterium]|nr:NADH dehydrogenase [Lachnospiraceae bacterium]